MAPCSPVPARRQTIGSCISIPIEAPVEQVRHAPRAPRALPPLPTHTHTHTRTHTRTAVVAHY